MGIVSEEMPEWHREAKSLFSWVPWKSLLASIRMYAYYRKQRGPIAWFVRAAAIVLHRWWSIVTGADIPLGSRISGGLLLPHPNGVVIHPDAIIGSNCVIFQQVTIGSRGSGGLPIIGCHVDIGAGAKVLGPIKIGNNVLIGANAVVITDVPDNCVAIGVPAIITLKK